MDIFSMSIVLFNQNFKYFNLLLIKTLITLNLFLIKILITLIFYQTLNILILNNFNS